MYKTYLKKRIPNLDNMFLHAMGRRAQTEPSLAS